MLYPSPPPLGEERSPSKCALVCVCVCERARGPLIVSRTSARRIDLSHGKRQIAVRRRSFASLGRGCGATSDRGREREGGEEARKGGGKDEWRESRLGSRYSRPRNVRSNLLICLFSSSRFAREVSRKWNERRSCTADKGLAACRSPLSLRFHEGGDRSLGMARLERS